VEWIVDDREGAPDAARWPALAAFVRERAPDHSVKAIKRFIAEGRVWVNGAVERAAGRRLAAGDRVELRIGAPRGRDPAAEVQIVFEDAHVVVIDKPAGMSSVPYEERETDTAMDRLRAAWRRRGQAAAGQPLFVVHRIDRATSGLLVFARTRAAERALGAQFRAHTVDRTYLAVAHGEVRARRIESALVRDRGDGLRGSSGRTGQGKRAVTHLRALRPLAGCTLCELRLETGKTHQIRIHLAEAGHPLVGETVYVRDFLAAGGVPIASPRLLLHAATLGFALPGGRRVGFASPLPDDFAAVLARLERG
jgi:23S rRNA pseudouridine1911/1915/1917 synthase